MNLVRKPIVNLNEKERSEFEFSGTMKVVSLLSYQAVSMSLHLENSKLFPRSQHTAYNKKDLFA